MTEETLAGRAASLNGYGIAIAVFGKPPDFDADNDPLVRVEAGRLRSRLCEYYATVAPDETVRLDLKPGSYVPTFKRMAPAAAAAPPPPTSEWAPRRWIIGGAVAVVAAIAAIGAIGLLGDWRATADRSATREPMAAAEPGATSRILVQPFEAAEPAAEATVAFGITEEVLTRLGTYRDLKVLVRTAADDASGPDFLLSGSVSTANDTIRIVPQLIDARTGATVWTTAYDEPFSSDGVWQVVDAVATAVAAAVGEPYGPLFDAEVARTIPGTSVDSYHCLLRFVFALQVVSEGAHARATACFEQAVAAEPDSSMSWARLAALYRMEYLHGFNARPGSAAALDRAADAARRALDLDPRNAFGHQETAFLCLLRDDRAGFEEAVARTLALQPSADIRAALGINFIKMGEVERGRTLVDAAIVGSPRAPPFFFLGYAVDALRAHDYGAAYAWAQRMAARDWPLSQAFLAATAALAGEPEKSREAAARLLRLRPDFAAAGRELIARGKLGAEAEAQLLRGLALAGVTLR